MCVEKVNGDKETRQRREETLVKTTVPKEAIVLKFGSSVLGAVGDLQDVVTEIYRYARHGRKVVAVVSAFAGETDALIAEAASLGAHANSPHAPRLIALGEERAASLTAIACEASGLDARLVGARELGLQAGGPVTDAHPEKIDKDALEAAIDDHEVIIIPGFVAIGASGEPVLLGRGGTDLTAVFVAKALDLAEVTLIKDVDGVYDRDPATAGEVAQRYQSLSYDRAALVAGKLLQPKAIEFARNRNVTICVASLNAADETRVGAHGEAPKPASAKQQLPVAVAGLGVVGEGAALRIVEGADYDFAAALVRDASKPRDEKFTGKVYDKPDEVFNAKPAVIIDALSDGDAGRVLTEKALGEGVSIISANKQAIAGSLAELHALARANNAQLLYGASVGGGAPMIETLRQATVAAPVKEITAILNGTVNFILHAMNENATFDQAVHDAQVAGFAEADPSADLSGLDAKAKISILSFEAFGVEPTEDQIAVEGLDAALADKFANDTGDWRQIARVEQKDGQIIARVSYERVDGDPLFSSAVGEENVLRAVTEDGRIFECRGRGAGRRPTVESLLADLGEVKRGG